MKVTINQLPLEDGTRVILRKEDKDIQILTETGELLDQIDFTSKLELLFARRNEFRAIYSDKELSVIRYAPLHGHSGYSLLDGASKIEDMVKKAEYAMAITDHGNMFGTLDFYKKMKEANKQPIIGCELYSENIHGKKERHHLLVLAETLEGYKNLSKLSSLSYDNFYYKPQVSYDMLREYSKGLIVTSACMSGEVAKAILRGDMNEARLVVEEMIDIFGKDNYFIEIQRHGIEEEKALNKGLIQLAKEYDLKMIATADSHYTNEEDRTSQEILLCIGTRKKMDDPDRMKFDGGGYHIHTSEEMEELFSDMPEVLDNTLDIAERTQFNLLTGELFMPTFDVPVGFKDEKDYFVHRCWEGFKMRFAGTEMEKNPEYLERLQFEIDTINNMGFPGYFLITWDVIKFAKDNGILVGPGRGSACGSLVAYVLKITDIDPIPYGLLFERFLNPDRISMPDIDTDFPDNRRDEVVDYVREKYGVESVAKIVTFTRLTAKSVVRDVARVLGYPTKLGDKISKTIPATPGMTLDKAFELSVEFKDLYDSDEDVKSIVDHALLLEETPRNTGIHACFDKDTLVTTKDGLVKISEVEKGTEVLTHERRFKPVHSTMVTKTDKVYHVHATNAFPLETTGNHPFLVKEMTYRRDRSGGKDVLFKTFSKPMWKEASDLEVGKDYVGIPVNTESEIPNNNPYNLPFSNKYFWTVIGRYLGDGWTEYYDRGFNKNGTKRVEKRVIICCSLKNDEYEVVESMLRHAGIDYRMEQRRTTYKFFLKMEGLYEYLQEFGAYAHGKHLNSDVINLPVEFANEFLSGYMSADGHFQIKEGRYSFKTASKELAIGLMQLVNKVFKRPCMIYTIPEKEEYIEGRKVKSKEKYSVNFTTDKRKKEKSYYDGKGYIWSRIKSVEIEDKNKDMYNLTVLDDSSYVVHGVSVHNCGFVISPTAITNYLPQFRQEDKETGIMEVTTQYNKDEVEQMGLLKMDFLGLRTMSVIDETLQDINKKRTASSQEAYTLENIPMFDLSAYKHISEGKTAGVFQLESDGMTSFMKQLFQDIDSLDETNGVELFERLIAGISLYRPGPIDEIPNYINNMINQDDIHYDVDKLEPILNNTYGIIVYQEQCMQIVRDLAGFSKGQSDTIRKGMAKKNKKLLNEYGPAFIKGSNSKKIQGCVNKGIDEQKATDIWDKMIKFSEYAFNKSHAAGYSYLAIKTAYLAAHYPVEYLKAILNSYIKNSDKIKKYMGVAKRQSIQVLPPNINRSEEYFSVDGEAIRFGLKGIRSVGATSGRIIEERENNDEFDSMKSFIMRMLKHSKINRMVLESLIYSGALDQFEGTRKGKLIVMDEMLEFAKMLRDTEDRNVYNIFDLMELKDDPLSEVKVIDTDEMDKELLLERERKYAGFYITEHPIAQYNRDLKRIKRTEIDSILSEVESEKESRGVTEYSSRKTQRIAGVITNVNTYYTKKTNEPLKVFTIEDESGEMTCIVFNDVISRNKALFEEEKVVFIEGKVSSDERGTQLVVSTVADIHDIKSFMSPKTYVLKGSDVVEKAREQFVSVRNLKNKHGANGFEEGITLKFKQNGELFDIGFKVSKGKNAQNDLKNIVGQENFFAEYE